MIRFFVSGVILVAPSPIVEIIMLWFYIVTCIYR